MLSRRISLSMAIALIELVAVAQADTINFNNLTAGPLNNNGGWTFEGGVPTDTAVVTNTSVEGWLGTGMYIGIGNSSSQGTAPCYQHVYDNSWLESNRDFDISVLAYYTDSNSNQYALAGVMSNTLSANDYLGMGVAGVSGTDRLGWYVGNYWRGGSGAGWEYLNLNFTPSGQSKTLQVGAHFTSVAGNKYEVQRYYINMTDDPGTIVNVGSPWTSVAISDIGSVWTKMRIIINNGSTGDAPGMLDDIVISQVPEPSALAILTCCLVGLLVYAWRKRN